MTSNDDQQPATLGQLKELLIGVEARLDKKLGGLEARFDKKLGGLEARFDKKLGGLETRFDKKLGGLETRVEEHFDNKLNDLRSAISIDRKSDLNSALTPIKAKLDQLIETEDEDVTALGKSIQNHEQRLTRVETEVATLK